jgi:hypothetical protein
MRSVLSLLWALGLAALAGACGGNEPPPKAPKANEEDGPRGPSGPALDVSAEIGALDEAKVEKSFAGRVKGLSRCLEAGAKRIELIGGQVAFFVKIDQQGRVAHAHLEKSTLGDRETEKCMLDALRAAEWPAPVGGLVGLARKGFDFDPPNDVRPPTDWDAERTRSSLDARSGDIEKCKGDSAGSFTATLYVAQNGSVLGVGVTPPDEAGESKVDCLVGVLKGTKFPSPGSWPAKVTVAL